MAEISNRRGFSLWLGYCSPFLSRSIVKNSDMPGDCLPMILYPVNRQSIATITLTTKFDDSRMIYFTIHHTKLI